MTHVRMAPASGGGANDADRACVTREDRLPVCIRYLVSCRHELPEQIVVSYHRLQEIGFTEEEILHLEQDPGLAPLEPREAALVEFVIRALESPRSIAQGDIDALYRQGWTDAAIARATRQGAGIMTEKLVQDVFERTTMDAGRHRGEHRPARVDLDTCAFLRIIHPLPL